MNTLLAQSHLIPTFRGREAGATQRQQDFETVVEALTGATKDGLKPHFGDFIDSLPEGLRPEAGEVLWSLIDDGYISLGTHFEITVNRPLEARQVVWKDPADVTIPVEWDQFWRP